MGWNRLAEAELISPDELAAMLFDGDIPSLSAEEERAFVELAPVYQPKRSKRLTYESRRKHAKVELIRMCHRLRKEHATMVSRAKLLDIPLEIEMGPLTHIDEEGRPYYSRSLGIGSCDTISADELWPTNATGQVSTDFNLTGAGVTLAMWESDGGINETHPEFAGHVIDYTSNSSKHPNGVAGVMVGAGVTNNARGVAPVATLHAYKWNGSPSHMVGVVNEGVVRLSCHTYYKSQYYYGQYAPGDEARDELVYTAYYHLPVFAAGNERGYVEYDYDTLNAGVAKNVLTVGAVEELVGGYSGTSNVVSTFYSSWGPTDDDRIKPDLVASGFSGWHPSNQGVGYDTAGQIGTSFSAPAVTGSLGLLQELHGRLHGTNGVPMLASSYKGLVIHTADEAGAAPGPDYQFGWGLMNAHSAADLLAENAEWNSNPYLKELSLPDGDEACFPVVADTNQSLRVTICWSDPAGEWLQNDLDLRVIGPTGQTNFPWVLNPASGHRSDPATKGDNTVDNVEQVEVTNVVAGSYTVLVNHKGVLGDGAQEVSIILSGIVPENVEPDHYVFSLTSNGIPRVDMPDIIGSVFEISRVDELLYSVWEPVPESPISILRPHTEWTDPEGSTSEQRFYMIKRKR